MKLLILTPAQLHCTHCVCVQNDLINTTTVMQHNQFSTAEMYCFLLSLILLVLAFKS